MGIITLMGSTAQNNEQPCKRRRKIRFSFDVEKFADAMAFLASRGVNQLTTMKAVKLLYFADREHLLKYGRPILGDWYACMDHGPVPSSAYDILKQIKDPDPTVMSPTTKIVSEHITTRGTGDKYPVFVPVGEQDFDALSDSDLEILDMVVEKYGKRSAMDLSDETHKHAAWRVCREAGDHEMDYRQFFDDCDDSSDIRSLVEMEQENRDVISLLKRHK